MPPNASRHLSPAAVARKLCCRDSKVAGWIKSGELRAANLAAVTGGKPRYRIDPADLETFLVSRQVVPMQRVRRRRQAENVIEFF